MSDIDDTPTPTGPDDVLRLEHTGSTQPIPIDPVAATAPMASSGTSGDAPLGSGTATRTPVAAPDDVTPAPRRVRPMVRVRTVVFGLVLLAISLTTLVTLLTGLQLNGPVALLTLLIGAGAALVAGGVVSARREARGGPGAVR